MLTKENYDKDHILLLQKKSKRDPQLLERTLPRPKSQSSSFSTNERSLSSSTRLSLERSRLS